MELGSEVSTFFPRRRLERHRYVNKLARESLILQYTGCQLFFIYMYMLAFVKKRVSALCLLVFVVVCLCLLMLLF